MTSAVVKPVDTAGQVGARAAAGSGGWLNPSPEAEAQIDAIRQRIDEIDRALVELWRERTELSQQIGAIRVGSGGPRRVLARESVILNRFRAALGNDGVELANLLLRAGRGPV